MMFACGKYDEGECVRERENREGWMSHWCDLHVATPLLCSVSVTAQ